MSDSVSKYFENEEVVTFKERKRYFESYVKELEEKIKKLEKRVKDLEFDVMIGGGGFQDLNR